MLERLAKYIENKAVNIVVAFVFITIGFAYFLPAITFETDLTSFLPDNELVRANERVNDNFGTDFSVHYIYIEEHNRHNDVLSPDALREQYEITQQVRNVDGVVGTICVAELVNEICVRVPFINKSISECSNTELEAVKETLIDILDGTINFTYYLEFIGAGTNFTFTLNDIEVIVDMFLPVDFDPATQANPVAHSTIILVQLNGSRSLVDCKRTASELRDMITNEELASVNVEHTGRDLIGADIDENSNTSFIILGLGIIGLIIIVLALSFRRISYVVLPLITLVMATVWTFGTMVLLGIEFTVIEVAVIPLIIGLGVDYSVHISRRYQEELKKGKSIDKALVISIKTVGAALVLAVLTTMIAFMANVTSDISPIRDFGIVCGLGIGYAFLLTILFQSACRFIIDKNSRKSALIKEAHEPLVIDISTETATKSVTYFPVLVIIVVAMITTGAVLLGVNVRTEFNDTDFLPEDWASVQTQEKLQVEFNASSYSQAFILVEADAGSSESITNPETLLSINKTLNNIADDEYVVKIAGQPRTVSILDYIERALAENTTLAAIVDPNNDGIPDDSDSVKLIYDYLYDTQYSLNPLSGSSTRSSELASILHRNDNGEYDATLIRVYVNLGASNEIREMYRDLEKDIASADFATADVIVTGGAVLTITTMDSLQESQIISTIVAVIFSVIILVIIYRSVAIGLIAIVPVVLSAVWIVGTMYIFSISLNVLTVMVTALTIGLGLDYAIHIIERFREERCKSRSIEVSIQRTIKNTGKALFISALTTVLGFIILIISPMPPIQHFGFITATTIIYSALLAVVVLPIMLGLWAKWHESR